VATNISVSAQDQRIVWSFWIAAGLTVVAGLAPLLLGGTSNRMSGVLFPFAVAAVLLAACALLHSQGKAVVSLLYVIAGVAVAYGILATLSTPLRLAVIGTCPPEPAACVSGLERPLTGGEGTALGVVIGFGVLAMVVGYFGLFTLYRRRPALAPAPSTTPPVRRIAPVTTFPRDSAPPTPAPPAVSEDVPPTIAKLDPEMPREPQAELPAPEPMAELPAPTAEEMLETPGAVSAPAPARKPRQRRTPKVRPEPPAEPNSGL
jgi:hypothetical protein